MCALFSTSLYTQVRQQTMSAASRSLRESHQRRWARARAHSAGQNNAQNASCLIELLFINRKKIIERYIYHMIYLPHVFFPY